MQNAFDVPSMFRFKQRARAHVSHRASLHLRCYVPPVAVTARTDRYVTSVRKRTSPAFFRAAWQLAQNARIAMPARVRPFAQVARKRGRTCNGMGVAEVGAQDHPQQTQFRGRP